MVGRGRGDDKRTEKQRKGEFSHHVGGGDESASGENTADADSGDRGHTGREHASRVGAVRDRVARRMIERADPLPEMPPELPDDKMSLTLPVNYQLR